MSYYIKDANNVVHSASPDGSANPFTAAIQNQSYSYQCIFNIHDPLLTPFIIIKDGNYPTYNFEEIRKDAGIIRTDKRYTISYPWIGNASFSSKNEQYRFTYDEQNTQPVLFYDYKCKKLSIKELYFGESQFITYSNESANVTKFLPDTTNTEDYYYTYNALQQYYPVYPYDIGPIIRGITAFSGNGAIQEQDGTFKNIFCDIKTDLNYVMHGMYNDANVKDHLKHIRTSATNIRHGIQPITSVYETSPEYDNPITYQIYDVSDYDSVNIKYLYNTLLAGFINSIPAYTGTLNFPINSYASSVLTCYCPGTTANNDQHPFIFNYFTANNYSVSWPNRTPEDGSLISDTTDPKYNLKSSLNSDSSFNDVDNHSLYNIPLVNNTPDIWNTDETNKRLFFTLINPRNDFGEGYSKVEKYHIKTCNGKYDYYITSARLDYLPPNSAAVAQEYNSSDTYSLGDLVFVNVDNERHYYFVNRTQITPSENLDPSIKNSKSPEYASNPEDAPWIDVYIVGYNDRAGTPNPNSAGADISYSFATGFYNNYLTEPNFIPYVKTDVKDCYFNNQNGNSNYYIRDISNLNDYINTYNGFISNSVWGPSSGLSNIDNTFNYAKTYLTSDTGILFYNGTYSYSNIKYDYVSSSTELANDVNILYSGAYNTVYFTKVSSHQETPITDWEPSVSNDYIEIIPTANITLPFGQPQYIKNHSRNEYIKLNGNSIYIKKFAFNYYKSKEDAIAAHEPGMYCYASNTAATNCRIIYHVNNATEWDIGSAPDVFSDNSTSDLWITSFKMPLSCSAIQLNAYGSYAPGGTTGYSNAAKTNIYYFKKYPYSGYSAEDSYTALYNKKLGSANKFHYLSVDDGRINTWNIVLTGNPVDIFSHSTTSNNYFDSIQSIPNWDVNHGVYNKNDIVKYNNKYYYSMVRHSSDLENHPSANNNIWNPTGYSVKSWLDSYNILNVVGSATLPIDTSNCNYLYLANPSTTLLDCDDTTGVFPNSACHVFITDLAVHVEPN